MNDLVLKLKFQQQNFTYISPPLLASGFDGGGGMLLGLRRDDLLEQQSQERQLPLFCYFFAS